MNNTGLFRVHKTYYKKEPLFIYAIRNELVHDKITSKNLLKLKNEVENKGYLWGITEMDKAISIANETELQIEDLQGKYGLKMRQ